MDDRVFGSLAPQIDDRRNQPLSPLEEARLIMAGDGWDPALLAQMPTQVTPLGEQAGMLDIERGHGHWLLARKFAEQQAAQQAAALAAAAMARRKN